MVRANAKTRLTAEVERILAERPHLHALKVAFDLLESPDTPLSARVELIKICLPYLVPKLSTVEVTGAGGEALAPSTNLFIERAQILNVLAEAAGDKDKKRTVLQQVQRALAAPAREESDDAETG